METSKKDGRRQFLKNMSLATLSVGVLPGILHAKASSKPDSLYQNKVLAYDKSTEYAYGQGPFYTVNAPTIQNDSLADVSEVGTRLIISGRVYNLDCVEALPDTEIDVWQANDAGA
jgi:protocatechuate 3,4-dioxygenase beta subunit